MELEECQTNVKFVVTSNTCNHDDEEKPVESCEIPEKTAFKICVDTKTLEDSTIEKNFFPEEIVSSVKILKIESERKSDNHLESVGLGNYILINVDVCRNLIVACYTNASTYTFIFEAHASSI